MERENSCCTQGSDERPSETIENWKRTWARRVSERAHVGSHRARTELPVYPQGVLRHVRIFSRRCQPVDRQLGEVTDILRECKEAKEASTSVCKNMERKYQNLNSEVKEWSEERESLESETSVLGKLLKKATSRCKECREINSRMEARETMTCDFVDIVRKSEGLTRQQYIRTIYAATLTEEVSMALLTALEQSLQYFTVSWNEREENKPLSQEIRCTKNMIHRR